MEALSPYFGSSLDANSLNNPSALHKASRVGFTYRTIRYASIKEPSTRQVRQGLTLVTKRAGRSRKDLLCRSSVGSNDGDLENGLRRKKLAVFVSGGGSNFRSIHEATLKGLVHGDVVVLVTDKPGCGGAIYAMDKSIPVIPFPKTKYSIEGLPVFDLVTRLKNLEIDFILLAGYLKLIPVELVQAFPRSILNIHPSLLPAFGGKGFFGLKVHQAVVASGARYSGPTIHFVDEHYDTGRILAQRIVPVLAKDTAEQLAARVLKEEHKLYVDAVAALCEDRVVWREDGVPLIRNKEDPDKYT